MQISSHFSSKQKHGRANLSSKHGKGAMPKRRGGQDSKKARKGTAEPDAGNSGSVVEQAQANPPDVPPSYTCPSCGAITNIQEMREDLDDIREYICECADKLGYSSEPGFDYEKECRVPPPATLSNKEVFEWWCDEHYHDYGVGTDAACRTCVY